MTPPWYAGRVWEIVAILVALVALAVAAVALLKARNALASARRVQALRPGHPGAAAEMHELRSEGSRLGHEVAQLRRELDRVRSIVYSVQEAPLAAPAPTSVAPAPHAAGQAGPPGRPVEFDGVDLRLSRSLAALGSLVPPRDPDGKASLFLNEQIQIDHVAFERWSHLFEFRGGGPYARYRTIQPATIDWNEGAGVGRPVSRGVAEVAS